MPRKELFDTCRGEWVGSRVGQDRYGEKVLFHTGV
jgi:hypothetical protein